MIRSLVRSCPYLDVHSGLIHHQALVLLYLAGWTHRDVSAGNIIVIKDGRNRPRGKLSDLEYAKEFTDESSSADPKTVCFL